MDQQKFKTKREFIEELGLSKSTFYRLVQKKNIQTTPELMAPNIENELRISLGFQPLSGYENGTGHIGKDWDRLGKGG